MYLTLDTHWILVNTLTIDLLARKLKEMKEVANNCPSQAIKLSK